MTMTQVLRHLRLGACGFSLLLLTGFFTPLTAADYTDSPQPPASSLASLVTPLLATLNQGDTGKLRHFVERHFSRNLVPAGQASAMAEYLASLHHGHGQLTLHGFRHYPDGDPNELLVVLHSPLTDTWQMLGLFSHPEHPGKIDNLLFAPARWPSNVAKPGPLSEAQAISALEEFVTRVSEHGLFSGALLLTRGDKILYQSARGKAHKGFGVDNTPGTRFDLASLGKMFTGVAISQLFQSGHLKPTETLDNYLDEHWLPKSISRQIQIRHLLTHSSGLGNYAAGLGQVAKNSLVELDDYQPLFAGESLAFTPGSRQQYSNSGFFLLGVIIEKVTGQPYADYVQQHVFAPAGMKDTGFFRRDRPHHNIAVGYERSDNPTGWINNHNTFGLRGTPDGGSFSTVKDLHHFVRALAGNKLLAPSFGQSMLTAKPALASPYYGYGFNVTGQGKHSHIGHEGGHVGISTAIQWYPDTDYSLIILANQTEGAASINTKGQELIRRIH